MKERNQKYIFTALGLLMSFVLWTIAVSTIDVRAIGPNGSVVGFGKLNGFVHKITGVHMTLYTITDWLGLVPLGFMLGFAILGLVQLIRRKNIQKVDRSILVLGAFYIAVITAYLIFESFIINYRPVLIDGNLEASYPSSTALLTLCVIPTAMMQLNMRIRNSLLRKAILGLLSAFTAFMVIGRLISGVHWLTDIVGGALLSAGLVVMYHAVCAISSSSGR